MSSPDPQLTCELFWLAAGAAALLDALVLTVLARRLRRPRFAGLKWSLGAAAALLFAALWTWVLWGFPWEMGYKYLFPGAARWLAPMCFGLAYGAIALLFRWLALRLPGNPAVTFSLLGGCLSLPGHLYAVFARDLFDLVPALQPAGVVSTLVFGFLEFVFYWSMIVPLAAGLDWLWRHRPRMAAHAPAH